MNYMHFSDTVFEKKWRAVYERLCSLNERLESSIKQEETFSLRLSKEQDDKYSNYKVRLNRICETALRYGVQKQDDFREMEKPTDAVVSELENDICGDFSNVDYATRLAYFKRIMISCQKCLNWIDRESSSGDTGANPVSAVTRSIEDEYRAFLTGEQVNQLWELCPFREVEAPVLCGTYYLPFPVHRNFIALIAEAHKNCIADDGKNTRIKVDRPLPYVSFFRCSSSRTGNDTVKSVFSYLYRQTRQEVKEIGKKKKKLLHWGTSLRDLRKTSF